MRATGAGIRSRGWKRPWPALQKSAVAAIITLCAIYIFVLSGDVLKQIGEMQDASSDNVQWTLAQLEVEALRYRVSIDRVERATDLGQLRQRFDILYSRLNTIATARVYSGLRQDPAFEAAVRKGRVYLTRTAAVMDGADSELLSALPMLVRDADAIYPTFRRLALSGLRQFAVQTDARREGVAATLIDLAAVTLALVATLAILSVLLAHLFRKSSAAARLQAETAAGLKTIISASLDAVLVLDRSGQVQAFNGAAENLFGFTAEEAVGKQFQDLVLLENQSLEDADTPLSSHPVIGRGEVEMQARRKTGEIFPVELSLALTQQGPDQRLVSFIRDITERKAAEAELIEARDRALAGERAKADFLAVMSHEMRTPLNGLLGNLTLLEDTDLTKAQRDLVASIELSGRLLLHHANDVLDISKHDAGRTQIKKEGFRLDRLVGELVAEYTALARENGNVLTVDWRGAPVGSVFGDPVRLKQVLLNYISNAIKFTRNAAITLQISELQRKDDECLFEFRVIDRGIGMKPEDLARVFDEFVTLDSTYSRRAGGSGLGLALARRMAEAMGGEVGVSSTLGVGSEFWATVPLVLVQQVAPVRGKAEASTMETRPLDILIVEDNPINREVLKGMLKRDGHRISEAVNGALGVEAAEKRRYDVILMDVSMPVLDGTEATRAIRAGNGASRDAPIIAVTAHAMPEELVAFRDAGMTDCLTKPINRAGLRAMLSGLGATEPCGTEPRGDDPETIDRAQFDMLLDSVGAEAGKDLLDRFIDDAERSLGKLEIPSEATQPPAPVIAEIHRVAGAAGMFGAMRLKKALNRVESAGKSGDLAEVRLALRDVAPLWAETRASLRAIGDAPQASAPLDGSTPSV